MQGSRGRSPFLEGVRAAIRVRHYSVRTVQEQLRHADVRTTRVCTHVLERGGRGVRSPLGAVRGDT